VSLPLTLLNFKVQKVGEKAKVSWKTTNEINVDHFELERGNGGQYQQLAKIPAMKASGDHDYQFTDALPLAGRNDYRLKMVDIDGQSSYGPVVSVTFDNPQTVIAAIYPNPAKDKVNITVTQTRSDLSIQILSPDGKLMMTKQLPAQGTYSFNVS